MRKGNPKRHEDRKQYTVPRETQFVGVSDKMELSAKAHCASSPYIRRCVGDVDVLGSVQYGDVQIRACDTKVCPNTDTILWRNAAHAASNRLFLDAFAARQVGKQAADAP
jgi:hypothetical protein